MMHYKCSFTALAILLATATALPALRVWNGSDVGIEEMAFVASVSTPTGGQHCGGAILTSFYVMTAAHCFQNYEERIQVRVGTSFRSSGGTLIDVLSMKAHPDYTGSRNADLGILGLAQPIMFDNPSVMQAPLPFQDMPVVPDIFGFIAGWGLTQLGGSPSEQLKFGQVATISQEACLAFHQNPSFLTIVICATSTTVDICPGDTGGPMISSGLATGIATSGSCGSSIDQPSCYTNVASYSNWIVEEASGFPSWATTMLRNTNGLKLEVKFKPK